MSAEKSHLLISCPLEVRENFKQWCKGQGISMNRAFGLFMQQASNGQNWKIKQAILRRARANS